MSRIGKRVLTIPAGVTVDVNDHKVTVKGPKGELNLDFIKALNVKVEGTELTVEKLKIKVISLKLVNKNIIKKKN